MKNNDVVIKLHKDEPRIEVKLRPVKVSAWSKKAFWKKNKSKVATFATIYILLVIAMVVGIIVWRNASYAVIADGETIGYVKNHKAVNSIITKLVDYNTPAGTDLVCMTVDSTLKFERKIKLGEKFLNPKDVVETIQNQYLKDDGTRILIGSRVKKVGDYEPEPEYIKNDKMLAGESKVKSKAKKGKQDVYIIYTTLNGKKIDEEEFRGKILDKGTPAVIYKGTIGLPDGEDWKTYEGLPEFKDGKDLIRNAKTYKGLRYIWGGHNLNRGVDCIGFVTEMYRKYGIKLPRSHTGLRRSGKAVKLKDAKAGDIICYNGHVALYMGNGKIIHATRGKSWKVHVSKVNYSKKRHIITIRRVVK